MKLRKYKSYEPPISKWEMDAIEEGRELLKRENAGGKILSINV